MAVSKRLRYEILRRDNHTCRYCGGSAPEVPLRVDHVTPVALGGTDVPENLVTSCEPCNSGKSSATVDSSIVANVADDALRWAEAMKQAAAELAEQQTPKLAYRAAFESTWNEWKWEHRGQTKTFDLPDGWKTSLDNFREAGLPQEVWPDVIEKAMTNKTVKADSIFRYCCGIAWRMVRELQDRAKALTGAAPKSSPPADLLAQAALSVWESEHPEDVTPEKREGFLASIASIRDTEDPDRIIFGAQQAAWCGTSDVVGVLQDNDRGEPFHQWWCSWLSTAGDYPPDERGARMREQIDTLLAAGMSRVRITRAAVYAGSRLSTQLHFGMDADEQGLVRATEWFAKSMEIWREAFHASAGRWPSDEVRAAYIDSLSRVVSDGDIYIADLYAAAASAGAYQDPDISTCLPRHGSAIEIASRPLVPAA